jgi:uncharacterized tellurite resistance protein B-like protein
MQGPRKSVHTDREQVESFGNVERVIADSLRFKRKLAIGDDAYTSMRFGKTVAQLWDVGGVAATGGQIAASASVASKFFASGGLLSTFGLGAAAATPAGWVLGTALVTAGAYYGVTRLFKSYAGTRVETIPKFINTPIDLLGASLMDFLGGMGIKISLMDGQVTEPERSALQLHFIDEWGFDKDYVSRALAVIEENSSRTSIKDMTTAFSSFARANPDCNFNAMRKELLGFLRELAMADGVMDEREELAVEKIGRIMGEAGSLTSAVSSIVTMPSAAVGWMGRLVSRVRKNNKSEKLPTSNK